jgi:flagellar basal body-associated protein FliL
VRSVDARAGARARLAAEQAQQQRRRRRLMWVGLPVALVVLIVAALVVVKVSGVGDRPAAQPPVAGAAADQVIAAVSTVPAGVLD